MKTLLLILLISFAVAPSPLAAKPTDLAIEAAKLTNPADVLLAVMRKTYETQIPEYRSAGLNSDELDLVWSTYAAYTRKVADDPDLISSIASEYDKRFSPAELRDLISFYRSPTGKKMLAVAGEMKATTDKFMDVARDKYKPMLVEGIDQVSAAVKKRLTSRQSQRHCLSRLVLTHESRQATPWLICNVRQKF